MKKQGKPIRSFHFIGIGGVAMAQVAAWLKRHGNTVTGSDQGVYPPMSDFLREEGIEVLSPYRAENIGDAQIAVIGNAISRGNPEVETALEKRLPFTSLPQLIHDQILVSKYPIVVAGTHGKTTTTAAVAHLFKQGGDYGGCLIGGIPIGWERGFEVSSGRWFAIEGDEYDTAFFDKRPKFLHYQPQMAIINNIEFDHADIYGSLDDIIAQFRLLIRLIPSNGRLLINADSDLVKRLAREAFCPVTGFGLGAGAEVRAENVDYTPEGMRFHLRFPDGERRECTTRLWGTHQLYNLSAAAAAGYGAGMGVDDIVSAIASFPGVKRRLELKYADGHCWIYDDFAHHPTAVRYTLAALRSRHPGIPVLAAFEPRSNTMVRKLLQEDLVEALGEADAVALGEVHRADKIPPEERLDVEQIAAMIRLKGINVFYHHSTDSLARWLLQEAGRDAVIVTMSSGSFGGLADALAEVHRSSAVRNIY